MAGPQTPQRATPNSSRKRVLSSAFSRSSATPSHATKMSTIFRDAAIPLQDTSARSKSRSFNTKMTTIPLGEIKNIHFGSFYPQSVRDAASAGSVPAVELPLHMRSDTVHSYHNAATPSEIPYSISFPTPLPYKEPSPYPQPNGHVKYPNSAGCTEPRSPSRTISHSFTDEDCHSTHGVPFVLPMQGPRSSSSSRSSVHAWLESVADSTPIKSSSPPLRPLCPVPPASTSDTGSNDGSSAPPIVSTSSQQWNDKNSSIPTTISKSSRVRNGKNKEVPGQAYSTSSTPPVDSTSSQGRNDNSSSSSNKENHPPRDPQPTTGHLSADLARFGMTLPETPPKLRSSKVGVARHYKT